MKTVLYIIAGLLVVIIIGGAYIFMTQNKADKSVSPNITAVPSATASVSTLSEQPDRVKFAGYFSEAYLGKLAIGVQVGPPSGMPIKTTVFTAATDQFCLNLTLKKSIPAGSAAGAVYDVNAQSNIETKSAFPMEMKQGGSSGCEPISLPVGQYEKKIYVDDVLVAVLPFKIK